MMYIFMTAILVGAKKIVGNGGSYSFSFEARALVLIAITVLLIVGHVAPGFMILTICA